MTAPISDSQSISPSSLVFLPSHLKHPEISRCAATRALLLLELEPRLSSIIPPASPHKLIGLLHRLSTSPVHTNSTDDWSRLSLASKWTSRQAIKLPEAQTSSETSILHVFDLADTVQSMEQ
ncbi:hypothetical protein XPA_002495 [Xanthoria parietina]